MAANKTALLGVEDYQALAETGPHYQLVQGELHVSPAPNRYHQDISRNLEVLLANFLEEQPLGKVYNAPFDVYLTPHDVFQPDIVFIANNRLSILTDDGAHGAPTLIVEILSPSTSRMDRIDKKNIYVSTGVEELWLVDPISRTVKMFRLQDDAKDPTGTFDGATTFISPCFPGLRIDCAKIFKE